MRRAQRGGRCTGGGGGGGGLMATAGVQRWEGGSGCTGPYVLNGGLEMGVK